MSVILIECVVKGYHECGFTLFTVTTTMKSALILVKIEAQAQVAQAPFGTVIRGSQWKGSL